MTSAPNRKDLTSGSYVRGGMAELTENEVKFIEKHGKVKLTDTLKVAISRARDLYISHSRINKSAPQRKEVGGSLQDFKASINHLWGFFYDLSNSPEHAARDKIETELYLMARPLNRESALVAMIEKNGAPPRTVGGWGKLLKASGEMKEPVVNTDFFAAELSFLKVAVEKAIVQFEKEGAGDTGGDNPDDALEIFLATLNKIYDAAPGKKRARDKFICAVRFTMHDGDAPTLPKSLQKRTLRASRKKS